MKLRYLRAFIVLVAGLVTLIVNIKTQKNVTTSLFIVLVVLLVFYVLATLIVEILQKAMEQSYDVPEENVESEETQEENSEESDVDESNYVFEDEDDV